MELKLVLLTLAIFAATVVDAQYFRVTGYMNYAQAKAACERKGAQLAVILNEKQNAAVLQTLSGIRKGLTYWIGLTRSSRGWKWINDESLSYSYWAPGEPNNSGGRQNCAVANFGSTGKWDDLQCYRRTRGAICQLIPQYFRITRSLTFEQAKAACAERGAKLAVILNHKQQNAVSQTLSGIPKGQTYWIGLQRSNGWKWINGKSLSYSYWAPGEPNNYGGYQNCAVTNFGSTGKWDDLQCYRRTRGAICQGIPQYFRITSYMNFAQAKAACAERGAQLAVILNQDQNSASLEAIKGIPKGQTYWIGLTRSNGWKWINGQSLSYSYWAPGEPNNSRGNQNCVVANYGSTGRWDDLQCYRRTRGAICKRIPQYFRVTRYMNFDQAKAECAKRGARVAVILNEEQNNAVQQTIKGIPKGQTYWIGLQRSNGWKWINGISLSYSYWAPGEPNNYGGRQNCAVTNFGSTGKWDDLQCYARTRGVICQDL